MRTIPFVISALSAFVFGHLSRAEEARPKVVFIIDNVGLFEIDDVLVPQKIENVAGDPVNASVLADMKAKLKRELASLDQAFGEFGIVYPSIPELEPLTPKERHKLERNQRRKVGE